MFKIITSCPRCKKSIEAEGSNVECFELVKMEGCVIECERCGNVFLYGVQKL